MKTGQILETVINAVIALVVGLLGLRFIFRLFNANRANDLVAWLYENTEPLLKPFDAIFTPAQFRDGFTLEFTTLFAIIIYALVGLLLLAWADALVAKTSPRVHK